MSPEDLTHLITAAVGGALGVVITVMGWLINRTVKGVDNHLHEQDGKLDALAASRSIHGESIVELRVRMGSAESALGRIEDRQEDFSKFLQSMGFRKRDGDA